MRKYPYTPDAIERNDPDALSALLRVRAAQGVIMSRRQFRETLADRTQMVTTYTAMSADVAGQGTNTLWSTVRETLASALEHVDAMEAGREHLTVHGGTASGKVTRYAWHGDPQALMSRAHDMVIIVKD